jgi:hypothetical protein
MSTDPEKIREQIARCRRLAPEFDPTTRLNLEAFALELQEELAEIEGRALKNERNGAEAQ